ncbi:MAG: 50S ribosomal protein L10 [Chlamydiales bacterium]
MRTEKKFLLGAIKDKIENSNGFVITCYKDFSAARARQFRDQIAQIGGEFEVVPKRVFIKAAFDQGIEINPTYLEGHIGVVFSLNDLTQLIKTTVKYGDDHDQSIKVLGGHIEGEFCTAEEVTTIATLPSLDEMRAQILGLFEAPLSHSVGAIQALLTALPYCLEEKGKKD